MPNRFFIKERARNKVTTKAHLYVFVCLRHLSNPMDLNPLILKHFLIGSPITDLIYPDVMDVKVNRLRFA